MQEKCSFTEFLLRTYELRAGKLPRRSEKENLILYLEFHLDYILDLGSIKKKVKRKSSFGSEILGISLL